MISRAFCKVLRGLDIPPRGPDKPGPFCTGFPMSDLAKTIDDAFEKRNDVNAGTKGPVREAVDEALDLLDKGEKRVAEKQNGKWQVNQWLKKAVLLSFRLNDMGPIGGAPGGANWWDKVPSKFRSEERRVGEGGGVG